MHSQFGTFSEPGPNRINFFKLSFRHWSRKWLTKQISSKRNNWVFELDHDLGTLCRGTRIHMSGHADLGGFSNGWASSFLTSVQADTASAACPAHPGRLAMTSITFAAVIWDAEEPCSVNTAREPESSFTMSPLSAGWPLYFWNFGSYNTAFFEVSDVHQRCKMDCSLLFLRCQNDLLFCSLHWSFARPATFRASPIPCPVFSGRQMGLVQKKTLVVFCTRMPRETVRTTWNEVERRKKFSPKASILFSTESERHRLTWKVYTVSWSVLWLKL